MAIKDLTEELSQETLESIMQRKKRLWLRSPLPMFIPGYIASTEGRFDEVTAYMGGVLNIPQDSTYEFALPPRATNYLEFFLEKRNEFIKSPGDTILVKGKGFAGLKSLTYWQMQARTAHDLDQDFEVFIQKNPEYAQGRFSQWNVIKRFIIATHIDVDHPKFSEALDSAGNSQFQVFLWKFQKSI